MSIKICFSFLEKFSIFFLKKIFHQIQKMKISLFQECIYEIKFTAEASSLHGIPNLTSISKVFAKSVRYKLLTIIWLLCLLASYSACAWFLFTSIVNYFNYDVVTNIQITYLNKIIFPVVSICNYMDGRFAYSPTSIKNMILICLYNLNNCDYENDFEYYRDVNLGACFRYNSGRSFNGSTTPFKYMNGRGNGAINEFTLMLNVGSVVDPVQINYFRPTATSRNGMLVFISNENSDSTKDPGISINTGVSTAISLNRQITRKYPQPYSSCLANLTSPNSYNSECYRRTFRAISENDQYHFSDCANLCLQKHIGEQCNCQSYLFAFYFANMSMCNNLNLTVYMCQINGLNSFSDEYLKSCDCPLECESIQYTYSMSYLDFPTKSFADYLYSHKNLSGLKSMYPIWNLTSYEDFRTRVAELRIFYNDMFETTIEQDVKIQLSDFVANLGGIMGIFSGFSFLTLVEIGEVLFNLSCVLGRNLRSKASGKKVFERNGDL